MLDLKSAGILRSKCFPSHIFLMLRSKSINGDSLLADVVYCTSRLICTPLVRHSLSACYQVWAGIMKSCPTIGLIGSFQGGTKVSDVYCSFYVRSASQDLKLMPFL